MYMNIQWQTLLRDTSLLKRGHRPEITRNNLFSQSNVSDGIYGRPLILKWKERQINFLWSGVKIIFFFKVCCYQALE